MGAHLYDNHELKRRELHINGELFAYAHWDWILKVAKVAGGDAWIWKRWRPDHRFGHYTEPPKDEEGL